MPLRIAKMFHKATLLPETQATGIGGIVTNNTDTTTKMYVRIISILMLFFVFCAALGIAVYDIMFLGMTSLPSYIIYVLATGVTYALNTLGLQSGVAISQNTIPTLISSSVIPSNVTATVTPTTAPIGKGTGTNG